IFGWSSGSPLTLTSGLDTLESRANLTTADQVGPLPDDLGKVVVGDGTVRYFTNLSTQDAPLPDFGGHPNLADRFTNQVVVDSAGDILLQNPAPGTTGNMAANFSKVEGPASLDLDMALSKRVQIGETTTFTIRADAINLLNTPQWSDPNTDINSDDFG